MAKKVKAKKGQIIDLVVLLLGIAAICMMFLTAVNYTERILSTVTAYAGTAVVFGNEDSGLAFSFMAMLPYLLTLIGVVLVVLKLFNVFDLELVAFIAFVVAAVFFFITPSFVVFANQNIGDAMLKVGSFSLGVGSILAGVFSALSGLAILAKKFVK